MISHNHQKKIAVINDLSGFGRCSLAVSLPIISHMRIQCCPFPTSILSNHTGFEQFFFDDYTDKMEPYMEQWEHLGLEFEGISTGFLGSLRQIQLVKTFFEKFKTQRTKIIIDPVMGDNGKLYSTYTPEMCDAMKELVRYADILTPNLTECCNLTNTPYKPSGFSQSELFDMAYKLSCYGAKKVVISGIEMGQYLGNVIYEEGSRPKIIKAKKVGQIRSGTGDIFCAIIAADCVNGVDFEYSVRKSASFIKKCIIATEKLDIPKTDGVCFEEVLHHLSV